MRSGKVDSINEGLQINIWQEELKWKHPSWNIWLKLGDKNMEYFHCMVSNKQEPAAYRQ